MVATDVGRSQRSATEIADRAWELFDWRRPSQLGREHLRAIASAHDLFARQVSTGVGGSVRSLVQAQLLRIEQVPYDDYLRSLPNPSVLAVVNLPPLPGSAIVEMNAGFALQMVDRMLGGRGLPIDLRRPTDIEAPLVRDLVNSSVKGLTEAIGSLTDASAKLSSIESNPQLLQITSPGDTVLQLAYRLVVTQGYATEGLLTVCYPSATLAPILDDIANSGAAQLGPGPSGSPDPEAMAGLLGELTVDLRLRLDDTPVRTGDLVSLEAGDVLRLDHRVDRPVRGQLGDAEVLRGHLGRRGRRLAVQVEKLLPSSTLRAIVAAHSRGRADAEEHAGTPSRDATAPPAAVQTAPDATEDFFGGGG